MQGKFGKNQWKVKTIKIFYFILRVIIIVSIAISAAFLFKYVQKNTQNESNKEMELSDDIKEHEKVITPVIETKVSDIEPKVNNIQNEYESIVKNIASGAYQEIKISEGISLYYDGDALQAVIEDTVASDDVYKHFYYYKDGKLIFAYYEGADSHFFYFDDDVLIQWRYCADSSVPSDYINRDLKQSSEYIGMEEEVLSEGNGYLNIEIEQYESISMSAVTNISATSALTEYGMTHSPNRICDGDISTAWVEGVTGQGENETVVFMLNDTYRVSGFQIYSGYQKNSDLYSKNSRPSVIELSFDNGENERFELDDTEGMQSFQLQQPVETSSVMVKIISVYAGWKYTDTAISELSFF